MNQAEGTNYYEILEIAPEAPPHEIHKAYQRAKSTYSADNPALYSMFSPEEAKELLRLVEEAYLVLGNPGLRRNYDEARLRGEPAPQMAPSEYAQPPQQSMQSQNPTPAMQTMRPPQQPQMPTQMPAQVAQVVHSSLPDFALPDHAMESQQHHSRRSTDAPPKQSPLPLGMGRTSLSTYKIDESFEAELAAATDFDGNLIQRTRLYKNISIDRMSDATRISRTYIMALETNDFKSLPAAVFTRGFVVQIARILGLPDQKVGSSYIKIFKVGGGK